MAANLFSSLLFILALPVAVIGLVYYLLRRFRRGGLSRAVHIAFQVTLVILTIWACYLFWVVSSGDGWSQLILVYWFVYFIPVAAGSFVVVWSMTTLAEAKTDSRVISGSRRLAVTFLILVAIILAGYGYKDHKLKLAGNTELEPGQLRSLYHSQYAEIDSNVARRLASNPATPVDVLLELARHDDISIRRAVCSNPTSPLSVLSVLAEDEKWNVRWCVPLQPNVSKALLIILAGDESADVRRSVAQSEAPPPELLLKLCDDSQHYVRMALARNMSTPVEGLIKLAADSNKDVRRLVAPHPALPLEQQLQLTGDPVASVREGLLYKMIVPREVLAKLENDNNESIRHLVKERYRVHQERGK